MTATWRNVIAVVALPAVLSAAGAEMPLFRLPLSATVLRRDDSGDTWRENGFVKAPFASAFGQFESSLARDNWRFVHRIDLSRLPERALFVWRRGESEITLMLWRESPGRTGFSWGVDGVQPGNDRQERNGR